MKINSAFDRTRSMRINRTLRNISLSLAFASLVFAVMSGVMLLSNNTAARPWELVISALVFIIFANLGLRFHVNFKKKD